MKNIVYQLSLVALIVPAVVFAADEVAATTSEKNGFISQATSFISSTTADVASCLKQRAIEVKDEACVRGKVVVANPKSFVKALISKKTLHDTVDRVTSSDFMKYWAIGAGAVWFNNGGMRVAVDVPANPEAVTPLGMLNHFMPVKIGIFNRIAKRYHVLGLAGVGYHYLAAAYDNAYNDEQLDAADQVQEDAQPARGCTNCTKSGCKGGRCGK